MGLDQSPTIQDAKQKGDAIDDEFSQRLHALEEKAKAQKLIRDDQKRQMERKQESDRDSARGLGIGLSIAYTLIGCPILGLIIGFLLDGPSGSMTYKNWGMGLGCLLGIMLTFFLLSKANRKT
jgi:F0F1-type ATP synthase assembly protein I